MESWGGKETQSQLTGIHSFYHVLIHNGNLINKTIQTLQPLELRENLDEHEETADREPEPEPESNPVHPDLNSIEPDNKQLLERLSQTARALVGTMLEIQLMYNV